MNVMRGDANVLGLARHSSLRMKDDIGSHNDSYAHGSFRRVSAVLSSTICISVARCRAIRFNAQVASFPDHLAHDSKLTIYFTLTRLTYS